MVQPDTGEQLEHDLSCSGSGERLGDLAIDKLTGLLNRWGWDARAEATLDRITGRASALLLVEPDGFGRHGVLAGEMVLRAVASVLRNTLRGSDLAGRFGRHGGGEFLVLLPARDRQLGELIARRIRARIRRAIITVRSDAGEPVVISNLATSIGVAVSDPTTCRRLTLTDLLRQADAALLQARSRGGDQVVVAGGGARLTQDAF